MFWRCEDEGEDGMRRGRVLCFRGGVGRRRWFVGDGCEVAGEVCGGLGVERRVRCVGCWWWRCGCSVLIFRDGEGVLAGRGYLRYIGARLLWA